MTKRHKIPAHKLLKIPMYLTPSLPERGQFTRYTTAAPLDIWNRPTLECVARHCLCSETKQAVQVELARRDALASDYLELIGYDPFIDDPNISPDLVAETLAQYTAERESLA